MFNFHFSSIYLEAQKNYLSEKQCIGSNGNIFQKEKNFAQNIFLSSGKYFL